jgi:riboflavin synthase
VFTGIIEELGTLVDRIEVGSSLRLQIEAGKVLSDLNIDDSISIDGCCQTVTGVKPSVFEVIAVSETLKKTTLGSLTIGARVNLERAATLQTRLGGHLVQGHVDARARIASVIPIGDGPGRSWEFHLSIPTTLAIYAVPRGSVTLNGVSLTIAETYSVPNEGGEESSAGRFFDNRIKIAIIPHTFEMTNFGFLREGNEVNLEVDVIAKMVEQFVRQQTNNSA